MRLVTSFVLFIASINIFVIEAASPSERRAMMMKIVGDCKVSTGASDNDIAKLMIHAKPSSKEGKCLFSCIMDNIGIVSIYSFF